MAGVPDPIKLFIIRKMLTGVRKLTNSRDLRLAVTRDILQDLMQAVLHTSESHYIQCMIRAMFSLSFFALLRDNRVTFTHVKKCIAVQQRNFQPIASSVG